MQINLLPKSKEQESKQKKVNFLTFSFSGLLIGAVAILVIVLYVINITGKSTIDSLDKATEETKGNISKYSELEKNVTSVVSGLENVKQILDTRPKWGNLYQEIESLMPKEAFLTEVVSSGDEITFKTKTISVEKVAEFIGSLRNFEIIVKSGNDSKKQKLFSDIEISNYAKETKNSTTYYMFDVKAHFTEDIWKIN